MYIHYTLHTMSEDKYYQMKSHVLALKPMWVFVKGVVDVTVA